MIALYAILSTWFDETYGHLGFKISEPYQDGEDLKFYFGILYNNNKTDIRRVNLERVMDFTVGDFELRRLLFNTLLQSHGYRLDNDFTPLKKIKQFELNG
jgi:hypothetical protein